MIEQLKREIRLCFYIAGIAFLGMAFAIMCVSITDKSDREVAYIAKNHYKKVNEDVFKQKVCDGKYTTEPKRLYHRKTFSCKNNGHSYEISRSDLYINPAGKVMAWSDFRAMYNHSNLPWYLLGAMFMLFFGAIFVAFFTSITLDEEERKQRMDSYSHPHPHGPVGTREAWWV